LYPPVISSGCARQGYIDSQGLGKKYLEGKGEVKVWRGRTGAIERFVEWLALRKGRSPSKHAGVEGAESNIIVNTADFKIRDTVLVEIYLLGRIRIRLISTPDTLNWPRGS